MTRLITIVCIAGPILLGIIFLAISLAMRRARKKSEEVCTMPVTATIADVIQDTVSAPTSDSTRTEIWLPVYEYTCCEKKIRRMSRAGIRKDKCRIGDHVLLMVDPDVPEHFYCPGDCMHVVTRCFFLCGAGLFWLGILFLIFSLIFL